MCCSVVCSGTLEIYSCALGLDVLTSELNVWLLDVGYVHLCCFSVSYMATMVCHCIYVCCDVFRCVVWYFVFGYLCLVLLLLLLLCRFCCCSVLVRVLVVLVVFVPVVLDQPSPKGFGGIITLGWIVDGFVVQLLPDHHDVVVYVDMYIIMRVCIVPVHIRRHSGGNSRVVPRAVVVPRKSTPLL